MARHRPYRLRQRSLSQRRHAIFLVFLQKLQWINLHGWRGLRHGFALAHENIVGDIEDAHADLF